MGDADFHATNQDDFTCHGTYRFTLMAEKQALWVHFVVICVCQQKVGVKMA